MAPVATRRFDAAVTGLGLVTPAGVGVAESWGRVLAGRPTAERNPALKGLPVDFSCRVRDFDANDLLGRRKAWRLDRFVQLAMVAAEEALRDAGLDPGTWDGTRVGVVLGSAVGGTASWENQYRTLREQGPHKVSPLLIPMLITNMVAGQLAIEHRALGPNHVVSTACAAAATAIGTARELLRSGACDIVITGGTEACLTPSIISGFAQMGALSGRTDDPAAASRPFDVDRDGFVAAEGAGILVLERPEHARARGARIRARISGYGASADAHHPTAPDPSGQGVERAMRTALDDAGLTPGDIAHVNAHGTSTPLNDAAEAAVLRRVFGDRPVVTSTKGVTGHALGAAGALEAAFTVLSVENGVVPPTANLVKQDPELELDVVTGAPRPLAMTAAISDSFGFGGQNAVLVVTRD
ncbi:beta-ketoacyl-[acyl-carrier-protein] synthase family protein [Streptomyces ficellus]|uniref:3-oxoacyl-[acyl-carrier-protein] synthase 2 n=1 Tax=Streptomyces ficellus TaxID=1977088 RepID=A0ABT7ZCB7_9ACTN|nr:beta-ketoacyl-[acyl-carrier-protein] synthase family protein [Streptomyces ficellus]MDN3297061.1 beta-ketoacyl-[acyl-carrier-protein] synthase family protein [Streptomyces ficellus]